MTRTKNTIAATLAALMIGGLTINPAAAAAKWSDISSVTHGNGTMVEPTVGGSDAFSRTDLTAVTHGSQSMEAKQIGRFASKNYRGSDITAITHN